MHSCATSEGEHQREDAFVWCTSMKTRRRAMGCIGWAVGSWGVCTLQLTSLHPRSIMVSKPLITRIAALNAIVISILSAAQVLYLLQVPNQVWFSLYSVSATFIAFIILGQADTKTPDGRIHNIILTSFYSLTLMWAVLGVFLFQNDYADCNDCKFTTDLLFEPGQTPRGLMSFAREQTFLGASAVVSGVASWVMMIDARLVERRHISGYQFILDE